MQPSNEWIFVVFLIVFAVVILIWHGIRARSIVEQWAKRNGYRVTHISYRTFFRGPFFWTTGKGHAVYRVTVEGKDGRRTAWVRCGSHWLGLFSSKVDVRWDEPPPKPANPMRDRWIDG